MTDADVTPDLSNGGHRQRSKKQVGFKSLVLDTDYDHQARQVHTTTDYDNTS